MHAPRFVLRGAWRSAQCSLAQLLERCVRVCPELFVEFACRRFLAVYCGSCDVCAASSVRPLFQTTESRPVHCFYSQVIWFWQCPRACRRVLRGSVVRGTTHLSSMLVMQLRHSPCFPHTHTAEPKHRPCFFLSCPASALCISMPGCRGRGGTQPAQSSRDANTLKPCSHSRGAPSRPHPCADHVVFDMGKSVSLFEFSKHFEILGTETSGHDGAGSGALFYLDSQEHRGGMLFAMPPGDYLPHGGRRYPKDLPQYLQHDLN